jgi:hypothetical protein
MSKEIDVYLILRYEGKRAIEYEFFFGQPSVKQDYTNSFEWHIVNPYQQHLQYIQSRGL